MRGPPKGPSHIVSSATKPGATPSQRPENTRPGGRSFQLAASGPGGAHNMTDTFERTQLDGKDRGQLSEIASALGVKAVSRLRKAELVEAIVAATSGASENTDEPLSSQPRNELSVRCPGDDH